MRLALYQPDIAQNVGSLIRLCACLNVPLDIIEPCGFPFDMRRIRQTAMDYIDHVQLMRHESWDTYTNFIKQAAPSGRLCLLTTKGSQPHYEATFQTDDILLCGRESAGVPEAIHQAADMRLRIPLASNTRSLNIASAATIVLSEALRQTKNWPS